MRQATAIILTLASSLAWATDITTYEWGNTWRRPSSWISWIFPSWTPGSDSLTTKRIYNPHVYAFLDAFDTREYVATHSGEVPSIDKLAVEASWTPSNSPERAEFVARTNVTARYVATEKLFDRATRLMAAECGSNVIWGSSWLEALCEAEGVPMQEDFTWEQNPESHFYNGYGSGWMPSFRALGPDYPFANEWFDTWYPGVAVMFAWEAINLKEPHGFSEYFYEYSGYSATPFATFPELISASFDHGSEELHYTKSHRINYEFFATFSRAVSLYDRTYFSPEHLTAITNEVHGQGYATCKATGEPNHGVTVKDGEILLDGEDVTDTFDVWFTAEEGTNFITSENVTCAFVAPRISVSNVKGSGSAQGTAPDGQKSVVLTSRDVLMLLDQEASHHTSYVMHAIPGEREVNYWITSAGVPVSPTNGVYDIYPTNGEYAVEISGAFVANYVFKKALDIDLQDGNALQWRYPLYTDYMHNTIHTFLQSYASVKTYKGDYDWTDIDFSWGDTSGDWDDHLNYGYASDRFLNTRPGLYAYNLESVLADLSSHCRTMTGSAFDNNALSYSGLSPSYAEGELNAIDEWSASWKRTCLGNPVGSTNEYSLAFTIFGESMDPPEIPLHSAMIVIEGSGYEQDMIDPFSIETRVKGIIQADWSFPQLHIRNL